jgi:uncharacterized protein (DUF2147 family)
MRALKILLLSLTVALLNFQAYSQTSVFGKWKTIDDETGQEKSIVEIYEKNGKVYGRIIELLSPPTDDPDPVCSKCPAGDPRKGQKIRGMQIIDGLTKNGQEYSGGTVLKPDEGKIYKCKIWVENGKLQVRGYWGFLYRTQTWLPVGK